MAQETLKEKTAKGLLWGGLSNGIQQLLNLVFGIILARLLSQEDYGMVGMLTIFSAVAACMQEGGFISALNRKKDISHNDYNAVFWMSVLVSLLLYLIFFFTAPLISRFYGVPELTPLARYTFLSFLFVSFSIAPRAYIFRNMMVRESSIISIASVLLSGVVGVAMAMNGFAYWGIATQNIVFTLTVSVLNFYYSGWRPSLKIDLSPIREIFGFSSKLIITNILTAVNANYFSVLLGRFYTRSEVGDFTQANKWNTMGHSLITNMLYTIAQPVLTKVQDDKGRQKQVFRKLLRFTAFVAFPVMLILSLASEEFIVILITEKWLSSAHLLRMLCVAGAVMPVSYLFSNLLISRGRSSAYMWSMLAQCVVQLLVVGLAVPWGISRMVMAYIAASILWVAVWFYLARKDIGLRAIEAVSDVAPYAVLSVGSVLLAYMAARGVSNIYLSLTVKVVVAASSYCIALWLLRSKIFREVLVFVTKKEVI